MVIDFEKARRKKIEEKVKQYIDFTKIENDMYLITEYTVNKENVEEGSYSEELYNHITNQLEDFVASDDDTVVLTIVEYSDYNGTVEVYNTGNDYSYEVRVDSELTAKLRRQICDVIAVMAKEEITVSFYLYYDLELLEGLVRGSSDS